MSTFKDVDLFGSGPHRFVVGREGQALASELFQASPNSGSRYLGLVELEVTVRGRLVAPDEPSLWSLLGVITAELAHPPEPGSLDDGRDRRWEDISFVGFQPADRVDRGREVSMGYTARFLKFREYPQ